SREAPANLRDLPRAAVCSLRAASDRARVGHREEQEVANLRIAFVARRYWPAVGGVESNIRHLARELAHRNEVTVLAHRIDDGPSTRLTDSLWPPPRFEPFLDGRVRVRPLRIPAAARALLLPLLSQVTPGLRRYAYGQTRVAA